METQHTSSDAGQGPVQGVVPEGSPITPEDSQKSMWRRMQEKGHTSVSGMREVISKKALLVGFFLLVSISAGAFLYVNRSDEHVAIKQFTRVYAFVPEKISKSAPIAINLPEGVSEEVGRSSISFSPEIVGEWQTETLDKTIVFKPSAPLTSEVFYAVNLDTGTVQMSGDFYVDEDPRIEAIFPNADTEAHEDSEITIVFNRPMVPLTTLETQELVPLPITITPETPGRFKWISTRNLQFIPDTTLIPSSDYTVAVGEGLVSLDGLPVAPMTQGFTTRPLRYEYISRDRIGYRSPIIIAFNQPVDLAETKQNIQVESEKNGTVAFEVEYGETTYYDYDQKKRLTREDQSKVFVYQRSDAHGRERLWDFDTTYTVSIAGASPLKGTKDLTEGRTEVVFVPNIVENVSATSDRTDQVRQDLMDPQGTIVVKFYDDIDTAASKITAKGLREIKYAERCKMDDNGEIIQLGSSCEKERDTRTLIFTFDAGVFGRGESFTLDLKKIVTPDGFTINTDPISVPLMTYPALAILRTHPDNQGGGAPLDEMKVCTNVPLKAPGEKGLAEYISADGYIVFGRWSNSQYVGKDNEYFTCKSGEFETTLKYGLHPETNYRITLALTDAFDQKAEKNTALRTGAASSVYTRFQNLQQQYNVTTPGKTKLTFATENLDYVNMHICKLNAETFLRTLSNLPGERTRPLTTGCSEVVEKRIELTTKYWVNHYFQINIADYFADTRGQYVVAFGHPRHRDYEGVEIFDRTYVSVTNLVVGKKEVERMDETWSESTNPQKERLLNSALGNATNLYWVNQYTTLAPVTGASVVQYRGGNGGYREEALPFVRAGVGATDASGVARVASARNIIGAVVTSGGDSAVVSDWADQLGYAGAARDASRTYIYTDRPIYRPGHTVHMRGIDRVGFDGSYEIAADNEVQLSIFDAEGKQIYDTALKTSLYGTFSTDFTLPADAPLGTYRIDAFGQSAFFAVEEYVPAAFKVTATTDKEEYINGDTFKVDVQADYYFGVPLDTGTVSYSVTSQDYYFDRYQDEYFNFGSGWYYCYDCGYGDNFLFRGETTLNSRGQATIERTFDFDKLFERPEEEQSKLVTHITHG